MYAWTTKYLPAVSRNSARAAGSTWKVKEKYCIFLNNIGCKCKKKFEELKFDIQVSQLSISNLSFN